MGLQLADQWVWDFWLVRDQGLWHVFFLHASQTPDDPDQRHFRARIGHAVSTDLAEWKQLEDVVAPGPPGSWDDLATWTGSVVAHPEGGWAMLYTGVSTREQGLVQRIGLALSDDLSAWVKHPGNPVIEADSRWYELLDTDVWFDQAWRDPWMVHDAGRGVFYALITARARSGPPEGRGVMAQAMSSDLVVWEVGPPLPAPSGFGYMEIPQVFHTDGRWHLLFSAPAWAQTTRPEPHCTGTFHATADRVGGPYGEAAPLLCDHVGSFYGAKVVEYNAGLWCLAFRNQNHAGGFVGQLSDPMRVNLAADGTMALVASHSERRS